MEKRCFCTNSNLFTLNSLKKVTFSCKILLGYENVERDAFNYNKSTPIQDIRHRGRELMNNTTVYI